MITRRAVILSTLITILLILPAMAFQESGDTTALPRDWFLKDAETDHYLGVSAEKAYSLLQNKPSRTVIVAVIDSGIDIDHEDLKDVLWVNEDEIAGNGIDDDKNGYVDDIHGWNFIGGKDGNVKEDTYEVTREYARLKPRFENITDQTVAKKEREEFEYWKVVKKKFLNDSTYSKEQLDQFTQQLELYSNIYATIYYYDSVLQAATGAPVTKAGLPDIEAANDTVREARDNMIMILQNVSAEDLYVRDLLLELEFALGQLTEGVHHYRTAVEYGYNAAFDSRSIVGDNPDDPYEKAYGNNDVEGPDPTHGTHVAGIIGANRKNSIGIKGIADNVKIMSVRAVPPGADERDKDVANAIIYAVDNGAQIINMSFGKRFSPHKDAVDKAVKYAESKGVLLVHGAGNDAHNVDNVPQYPSRTLKKGKAVSNWIEVGASSWSADSNFVATFSNYGKESVDLFAPGVEIYSSIPNNEYQSLDGTSMASPATAGVAALLMSYFPHLSAVQVRDILRQSTRKFDGLQVIKPGTKEMVRLDQISITGGLVDSYEAVQLAMKVKVKSGKR